MGGKISLFGRKNSENEDEENLRRYQEKLDADGTYGFSDSLDKKKVTFWQFLRYEKRMWIAYAIILGIALGMVIPVIIFATKLENREKPIYGSCLIKEHARFECLINSQSPVTQDDCDRALCCWQNTDDISFKCYHSFPSAYQYNVTSISQTTVLASRNKDKSRQGSPYTTWTQLDMKAAHSEIMSPLRVLTHWESTEHLVVELFNSALFPDRRLPSSANSNKTSHFTAVDDDLPFSVSWGEDERFFYVRVARRDTDETLFDTRLGPVYTSGKDITLATLLPTEFFYGMKGGQGSVRTQTYGIVNGFENSEFPFYISFENSGKWHGVLIDTNDPILVQVVQAPGLMLHLETDKPEMNFHFFAGPSQKEILSELHSYIRQKHSINHPPMIPPYWGLGLHLCRKLKNGTMVLRDIQALLPEDKSPTIMYDSDCIDEYLRHSIYVNETQFPPEDLTEILTLLETNEKRIVLSQKSTILAPPPVEEEDKEDAVVISAFEEDLEQEYFKNALILQRNKETNQLEPFQGQVGDEFVNYLDYFNTNFPEDFPPLPKQTNASDAALIPYNGFSMDDNFPKLDLPINLCQSPGTKLQSFFTTSLLTTSSSYINVSSLWGSVCPESVHGSTGSKHLALHNVYGEQALKKVHSSSANITETEILLTSGSYWTGSMYYGGYNGMQVPFTWNGLKEAVINTVRNYAMAPVSATPICGGMLWNVSIAKNNMLCLRWFQFGLLLPLARNSYDGISSYGPLDLPGQYQVYLNDAIKARYTLAPYYYTTLHAYQTTYVPMVRPMSFDFSRPHERNETLPLLDQFMVGDAIMAAPIIERGEHRRAYFTSGIWYDMRGEEAWNESTSGDFRAITGYNSETPMFIRGGYTVPTLQYPEGNSIEESLSGNYTLLAALSSWEGFFKTSKGTLTIKEPNTQDSLHQIDFVTEVSQQDNIIHMRINSTCGTLETGNLTISTMIDSVQIFGLPYLGKLDVKVKNSEEVYQAEFRYNGDHMSMRLLELGMDWCKHAEFNLTVTPAGSGEDTTTTEGDEETSTTEVSDETTATTESNAESESPTEPTD